MLVGASFAGIDLASAQCLDDWSHRFDKRLAKANRFTTLSSTDLNGVSRVNTTNPWTDNRGDTYLAIGGNFECLNNVYSNFTRSFSEITVWGWNKADLNCDGFVDFFDYDTCIFWFDPS